jgi:hypothetical protein
MLQGMPGTKFPDALLLVPRFPPDKEVIQAFLDCGYYFRYASIIQINSIFCTGKKFRFMYSQELRGLSPNFHIHVSVSGFVDLHNPTIGLPLFLQQNWQTGRWKIINRSVGTEAAQFLFWEY